LKRLFWRIARGMGRRVPPVQHLLDRRERRLFLRGGRVPHSTGYEAYKDEYIVRMLNDLALMEQFRQGSRLPARYGYGIDERCVEYPWLLSRLHGGEGRVLDAGSALNHRFLLDQPILGEKKLHIVTLAPEHAAFWHRGISYLYEDLRALPLADEVYDAIVCISTLEHIGFDASFYTGQEAHRESRPHDFKEAIRELRRVLKSGGKLYLTVPYGVRTDIEYMQVFDSELLREAVEAFRPAHVDSTYYLYSAKGWQTSGAEECTGARYVEAYYRYFTTPEDERPTRLPREADNAAAARAVACLVLEKLGEGQG
jgi:SAM-dependent methyltransferase